MLQEKERLSKNNYVYSVFISPSGKGLKVLVKIPQDIDNHVNYFNSLEIYFDNPHFDTTCKNISRVCYESYDTLLYVNENSSVWEEIKEKEYTEVRARLDQPTIPITDENKVENYEQHTLSSLDQYRRIIGVCELLLLYVLWTDNMP